MSISRLKDILFDHWPLLLVLLVFWIMVFVLLVSALERTDGHLVYALDDAYIHMAMAKNLSQHGVYGVTKYEFSSSSSSPFWTLILAFMYLIFGVQESVPFILNVLIASAVLVVMYRFLCQRHGFPRYARINNVLTALGLLSVVCFTPFHALVFSGMEHLLHILMTLFFLWFLARTIFGEKGVSHKHDFIMLCFFTVGMTMARFESYAILAIGCILLLIRGKWKLSIGIALAGFLPLLIYQYISVLQGWSWLPNSILIRGGLTHAEVFNSQQVIVLNPVKSGVCGFFANFLENFTKAIHVDVLILWSCIVLMFGLAYEKFWWKKGNLLLVMYILVALIHLQFAKSGHFYRYEAYLVAIGLFVIVYALGGLLKGRKWKPFSWKKIVLGMGVLVFVSMGYFPFEYRCRTSFLRVPIACQNIYEQQYQMGLFLQNYYEGRSVAVNDIGAVTFLGDIRLLDLVGLASVDVLKSKSMKQYTTEKIQQICTDKNVDLAIVYDRWFNGEKIRGVPKEWQRVGDWKIYDNVVCAEEIVTFYAVKVSEKENLMNNLCLFSKELPAGVKQMGLYMGLCNSLDTLKTQ